jgi:hypothetical protein
MANFESILDQPFEEKAERPKPLPVGTYLTVIQGPPEEGVSNQKKTPFIRFTHKIVSAADDVDPDALDEIGGIADRTVANTYYLSENALYRLDDFFEHCGVDLDQAKKRKMSRKAIAESLQNSEVYITIRHRPSQDGKDMFAEISGTAAA